MEDDGHAARPDGQWLRTRPPGAGCGTRRSLVLRAPARVVGWLGGWLLGSRCVSSCYVHVVCSLTRSKAQCAMPTDIRTSLCVPVWVGQAAFLLARGDYAYLGWGV